MEGVKERGGVDTLAGDTDRVDGALTAIESAVDAVVDKDVVDAVPVPVRSIDAASRGRPAADVVVGLAEVVLLGPFELALILILAASWFKDGKRPPPDGLRGCGASTGAATGGVVVIVMVRSKLETGNCPASLLPNPNITFIYISTLSSTTGCRGKGYVDLVDK
jgi:hypothetical protein